MSKLNGNNNNTQPEVTAELSDPEMSGAHLNNVNSSFSHEQEGRVTAVITKESIKEQPGIKPSRESNTLLGLAPVMQSSKFY